MRICFVAPTAFPFMDPTSSARQVGGAELQQSLIAKALAQRGHDVSMICMDYGQQDGIRRGGVTVFKCYEPEAGIPVLRFVYPRLTNVWRAMRRADADIYYQRTAGAITGFVAAFCRRYRKASIFCGAGNPDFDKSTSRIRFKRDKLIYEYGLRTVSQILVQNVEQSRLCQQNFGRTSIVVPNGYEPPDNSSADPAGHVLWVSTIRALKNPGAFLELAREMPQFKFRMIGGAGSGEEDLYNHISRESASIPNLEFLGYIAFSDIETHFDGARLFVNTSDSEGFPNTFLQSWARGIPTVSFVDCGARADGRAIGWRASSQEEMAKFIKLLMTSGDEWANSGAIVKEYFLANNSLNSVVAMHENIFRNIGQTG